MVSVDADVPAVAEGAVAEAVEAPVFEAPFAPHVCDVEALATFAVFPAVLEDAVVLLTVNGNYYDSASLLFTSLYKFLSITKWVNKSFLD